MRCVLDANVVVSGLIWGGISFELLEAASHGHIKLFCSSALLAELSLVLAREHLASRLIAKRSSVHAALATYAQQVVFVTPASVPRVIERDADDDQVLAQSPQVKPPANHACKLVGNISK